MFINTYDVTLTDVNDNTIDISLRLGIGAQMLLKKKYKESTTNTLFSAADDIDKLVDILTQALNWKGNNNKIKTGDELLELLNDNDMLGMMAKQTLLTSIGVASGLFSKDEKAKIDAKTSHMFDDVLNDETESENKEKNA